MNSRHCIRSVLRVAAIAAFFPIVGPVFAVSGEVVYQYTCRMCHGPGSGAAPQTGDIDAWAPRLKKGRQRLYDHAINGFRDEGYMPPRGGNRNLTDEQVKAAVDYMLQRAG